MTEGDCHSIIRKKVVRVLEAKGYEYKESHTKAGDRQLYFDLRKEDRFAVHFSDADIVIPVENKIKYIIEIEASDISPKKIVGDIVTTYISHYYQDTPISDAILFVVVSEGRKKEQFELIKKQLNKVLSSGSLKDFNICTEENFEAKFNEIDSQT